MTSWTWCTNASCASRSRIWIVWNSDVVQFTVLDISTQLIHWIVKSKSSLRKFHFLSIYGLHTIHNRGDLWDKLKSLDAQLVTPWLIMGDFNSIPTNEDMIHGSEVQDNETKDFRNFMDDCIMNELPTVGRGYIWTNNHVYSRIDRANTSWMLHCMFM